MSPSRDHNFIRNIAGQVRVSEIASLVDLAVDHKSKRETSSVPRKCAGPNMNARTNSPRSQPPRNTLLSKKLVSFFSWSYFRGCPGN